MTAEAGIEQTGQVQTETQQGPPAGQTQESGMNPNWNQLLQVVPQDLHSQVVPHLQQWDAGVTRRFQELQSQLKPYEQFKGVDPQELELGLNLMRAISENPEEIWRQLGARYGYGGNTAQPGVSQEQVASPSEEMWEGVHPDFRSQFEQMQADNAKLQEVAGIMAQMLTQQQDESSNAAQDAELDALYKELEQGDPVFAALNENGMAEPFINSLLMAEVSKEDALKALHAFTDQVLKVKGRPAGPRILGAGGMVPGQGIDIKKATNQQARDAVAAIIAAGAEE